MVRTLVFLPLIKATWRVMKWLKIHVADICIWLHSSLANCTLDNCKIEIFGENL